MKLLGSYKNGSYFVKIYDDGTKERIAPKDVFIPDFSESCDITITERCVNACPECYANCTAEGMHCNFGKYAHLLRTLHPFTEIAINGNNLDHPQLEYFLLEMKINHIIVNMTVNQIDFEKHISYLRRLSEEKLIYGLGVSLNKATKDFVDNIKQFPNACIHLINGIFSAEDCEMLKDNDLKILILGYKQIGRGADYYFTDNTDLKLKQQWLYEYLEDLPNKFKVVSFDNLALEQLNVKRIMSEKDWESFYMGDDGDYTFFINLVQGYFAKDSLSYNHYPIKQGMSIDDMFSVIRGYTKIC